MKFYYQLFFFLVSFVSVAQTNQLWKGYYSYQETKAIEKDDQNIYVATDNSVFAYNEYSKETEIFNTVSGLKINGITTLGYAKDYKKLVRSHELSFVLFVFSNVSGLERRFLFFGDLG